MKKESRNALLALGVFALSIILILLLNSLILVYYASATGSNLENAAIATTKYVLIVNELVFASLAMVFFMKVFNRTPVELGLTTNKLGQNILLGSIVGLGGWFAGVALSLFLEMLFPYTVPEWYVKMLTATSPSDLIIFLMLTWLLVGPCEELFFRGFVQGTFTFWKGPVAGVVAGTILFGLAHFDPVLWFRTIPSSFLGLVYGIVYVKRKSIVPVAVAHSLNDTIGLVLAFLLL